MPTGAPARKRLYHVDLMKSLAIYFVLAFHCTLYPNRIFPDMPLPLLLRYFSRTILSTCVPLFFFVNGYLLFGRPTNLKKHTFKTLKLMLVTCFWIVFLLAVMQYFHQEPISWQELKEDLWTLKDGWNNQLWFLGVLVGIYLVFPPLKAAFDTNRSSFYWFTAVLAVMVFGSNLYDHCMTVFNLLVKKEFWLYQNNLPVFSMFMPFTYLTKGGLAYFCLGGVAWALEERLLRFSALWRNLAAAAGMTGCCLILGILGWRYSLYSNALWDVVWNGYFTVFTLGNVLGIYVLSLNLKRELPLLRQIAASSMGIYLVHDLVHKSIRPPLRPIEFLRTLPGSLLYAALVLLLTLGICRLLKKIPVIRQLIS